MINVRPTSLLPVTQATRRLADFRPPLTQPQTENEFADTFWFPAQFAGAAIKGCLVFGAVQGNAPSGGLSALAANTLLATCMGAVGSALEGAVGAAILAAYRSSPDLYRVHVAARDGAAGGALMAGGAALVTQLFSECCVSNAVARGMQTGTVAAVASVLADITGAAVGAALLSREPDLPRACRESFNAQAAGTMFVAIGLWGAYALAARFSRNGPFPPAATSSAPGKSAAEGSGEQPPEAVIELPSAPEPNTESASANQEGRTS